MNPDRALSFRRRSTVDPTPAPRLDDAGRRRLVAFARAYGLAPETAALAVERAAAAAAEPWTGHEAAARRTLLDALRRDPRTRRPALGGPQRLHGPLVAGADSADSAVDWADVPAGERAVVAGALFDGLDLVGLARALGTHRLDVKARARRVLSRLAGEEATGSGLAAVRHMMAGEYALGLIPPDAFTPFQRGLALDPGLQGLVAGWDARFSPWLRAADADAAPPGDAPAPLRPAPTPRARSPRRAIALALAAVAVLGVGTAAWLANGDAPRPVGVVPETLPTPRRAVAAPVEGATARDGAAPPASLAATTTGRPAPSAAAPERVGRAGVAAPADAAAMAADPATARPPREVTATVTVYLHHRAGDPAVAARAAELAATLRGLGATVELIDAGGLVVRADRLRFFVPDDAPAARLLAAEVAGLVLQDFTHYVPQPAPGILELWLASEPAD